MVTDPRIVFSAYQQPSREGGRLMHARYFHKKGLLFLILILFIVLPVFSYGAEESITVTTYYPSPYGVYSEMRLYPKLESDATVCNSSNQEGLMFYDKTMHALRVCRCDSGGACLLASEFDYTSANYWTLSDAETELYPNNLAWNVGIGTAVPGQKLVVQAADTASSTGIGATIYLQSDTSAAANRGGSVLFGDTGTTRAMIKGAYEGAGSSGYLALSTRTSAGVMTEALRINSSGNVVIGTTAPNEKLVVSGGAILINSASTVDNDARGITANSDDDFLYDGQYLPHYSFGFHEFNEGPGLYTNAYVSGWGGIDFFTAGAERMRIRQNGNVGIGTVDPTQVLDVTGGTGTAVAIFENTGPNYGEGGRLLLQNRNNNANSRVTYASIKSFTTNGTPGLESGDLVFNTARDGTLSEKARIDRYGNVGFGTVGPVARLHVKPASLVGDQRIAYFGDDTVNRKASIIGYDFVNNFGWFGAVEEMIAWRNIVLGPYGGNVGIGANPNPSYKLDVSGSAHATSFLVSSDLRFKENIRPLVNVLPRLQKLRAVSFNWNKLHSDEMKRSNHEESIGVIAQEVREVFPEIVSTWGNSKEGYLAVDYGRFSVILLEAVKEQQAEIEWLKAEIKELKAHSK